MLPVDLARLFEVMGNDPEELSLSAQIDREFARVRLFLKANLELVTV